MLKKVDTGGRSKMPHDWKAMQKTYEEFKELAKKYNVPLIMPTQHPRPPGYWYPAQHKVRLGPDFIFIDYPDVLR